MSLSMRASSHFPSAKHIASPTASHAAVPPALPSTQPMILPPNPYNLAPFCTFLKIGSIFVAFITSPLTLSFPLINSLCAFALPLASPAKSLSDRINVTAGSLPSGARPRPTVPLSFRSICQDSSLPSFFSVKPKIAPPFLRASERSAGEERAREISSKAAEEGKSSGWWVSGVVWQRKKLRVGNSMLRSLTRLERHCGYISFCFKFDGCSGSKLPSKFRERERVCVCVCVCVCVYECQCEYVCMDEYETCAERKDV